MNFADEVLRTLRQQATKTTISFDEKRIENTLLLDLIEETTCRTGLGALNRGARVLLCISRPDIFLIAYYAVLVSNAVAVPIASVRDRGVTLNFYVDFVRPDIVFHDLNDATLLEQNSFTHSEYRCGTHNIKVLQTNAKTGVLDNKLAAINAAALMFTTGTGGAPKGVIVSHENLISTLYKNLSFMRYNEQTVEVNTLPVEHSFGLGQCNATIAAGGTLFLIKGLSNLKKVFADVSNNAATSFPTTPAGIALLTDRYLNVTKAKFASIKTLMINSAPMPPELTEKLREALPHARIMVYYGLTEASRTTFADLTNLQHEALSSVGKPLGNTLVEIDPSSREILISGDNVSPGYFLGHKTDFRLHETGKLRTGDAGTFDVSGNLIVLGRIGDEINVGGHKVDPQEIEKFCEARFGVGLFCLSEVEVSPAITELVLLAAENVLEAYTEAELLEHLSKKFDAYKVPKRIIKMNSIPTKLNGKIDRAEAKDIVRQIFDEKIT